ncbi:hypothetical protein FOZ60_005742 [Perkinsus olseni]|uniref:Pentacotripeptide-repeat region of PRORP domain-containing protein n=1 Tax=Perkinsus olseni TaxID=32597 RepID=A0A7J6NQA5_PEROL|nr:hypothetical protein FOZ60_005742 [Perkinsus olseni]
MAPGGQDASVAHEELLRNIAQLGLDIPEDLLVSVTKISTSKHQYKQCLWLHHKLLESQLGLPPSLHKTINSCLLFCAVEARDFSRCEAYFERIKAASPDGPSAKDYGNMMRYYAAIGEFEKALGILQNIKGVVPDNVTCNTVLSVCVKNQQLAIAEAMLHELSKPLDEDGTCVADVVTYNTVMKGYARLGGLARCDHLMSLMETQEIAPTAVTYGILLDCCINANDMPRAQRVFQEIRQHQTAEVGGEDGSAVGSSEQGRKGLGLNTVMYTTLIKGHAKAGDVDAAMSVYEEMKISGVAPDLITFSILIKSNCDSGRVGMSLGLLREMLDAGHQPDEIVYNNLLLGCCVVGVKLTPPFDDRRRLAAAILEEMQRSKVGPGNVRVLSRSWSASVGHILMKVIIATAGDASDDGDVVRRYDAVFEECLDLLDVRMERDYQVIPELRLYTQLAQQTIRQHNGGVTLRVCGSMIGRHMRNLQPNQPQPVVPKGTANTRNLAPKNRVDVITRQTVETLLASATTSNLLETTLQLLELFIKFRVVEVPDVQDALTAKLESMLSKKKRGGTYVREMRRIVATYASEPERYLASTTVFNGVTEAADDPDEGGWRVTRARRRTASDGISFLVLFDV